MLVSCLSLLNSKGSGAYYAATLVPAYIVLAVSVAMAAASPARRACKYPLFARAARAR